MVTKIIAWFVLSSKNTDNFSLTLKAGLLAAATYVVFFAHLFNLDIGGVDGYANIVNALVTVVRDGLMLVSAALTLWGFIRKLHRTASGTNATLNGIAADNDSY